jgi:hypothetical protein
MKKGMTGNTSVKVYSSNAGVPGTLLGTSATIIKSSIDTTDQGINFINKYHFATPITLTGNFFVSVVLPTSFNNSTNQLAIWSSQTSCSSTSSLAYEMWNDNSWHSFTSVYAKNIDLAIFPVICSTSDIDEIENLNLTFYPNPANNEIFVTLPFPSGEKVEISIFDIYGKLCINSTLLSNKDETVKIDLSNLSDGIYILKGQSKTGKFIEKISIIK